MFSAIFDGCLQSGNREGCYPVIGKGSASEFTGMIFTRANRCVVFVRWNPLWAIMSFTCIRLLKSSNALLSFSATLIVAGGYKTAAAFLYEMLSAAGLQLFVYSQAVCTGCWKRAADLPADPGNTDNPSSRLTLINHVDNLLFRHIFVLFGIAG